jgi:hypothetical protein
MLQAINEVSLPDVRGQEESELEQGAAGDGRSLCSLSQTFTRSPEGVQDVRLVFGEPTR